MVNVLRRTRKLQTLLSIRNGPGAVVLPPEVARIHMEFSSDATKGHGGAKKFWRDNLVRLKYHNPAVPMTITRTRDSSAPATMTLTFSPPSTKTPSTEAATETDKETTKVIDMRYIHDSAILAQLVTLTKARAVRMTPEDTKLSQDLEEQEVKNNHVRELMKAAVDRRKKEAAILNQARGEAEALKSED